MILIVNCLSHKNHQVDIRAVFGRGYTTVNRPAIFGSCLDLRSVDAIIMEDQCIKRLELESPAVDSPFEEPLLDDLFANVA